MRIFALIACLLLSGTTLKADPPFIRVKTDKFVGYIIPAERAPKLTQEITSFWTPTSDQAIEADAAFHRLLESAKKDPKIAFPELAWNKDAGVASRSADYVKQILESYPRNARQFFGTLAGSHRLIHLHGAPKEDVESSGFIFINVPAGFWDVDYDPRSQKCLNFKYCDE